MMNIPYNPDQTFSYLMNIYQRRTSSKVRMEIRDVMKAKIPREADAWLDHLFEEDRFQELAIFTHGGISEDAVIERILQGARNWENDRASADDDESGDEGTVTVYKPRSVC